MQKCEQRWFCALPRLPVGPGVARSIESDVDNLMRLISIANILPKGMYVENAVKVRGEGEQGLLLLLLFKLLLCC